jgi:8-oxo-dGTP diphosphatase
MALQVIELSMYITAGMIDQIEAKYGRPVEIERAYEMTPDQLALVRRGQRGGRCHDVTIVIADGGRIAVIRKPSYPAGAYRAPSGGVEIGEGFDMGAAREAREETGLEIELERYLIRALVRFSCGEEIVLWTSHVMQARMTGGVLQPLDTREIVEAKWATDDEILGPIRQALLTSGSPGLCYRADLDALALSLLREQHTP